MAPGPLSTSPQNPRLREKTETVLAALGQNPDAIQHVMPSVRPNVSYVMSLEIDKWLYLYTW